MSYRYFTSVFDPNSLQFVNHKWKKDNYGLTRSINVIHANYINRVNVKHLKYNTIFGYLTISREECILLMYCSGKIK